MALQNLFSLSFLVPYTGHKLDFSRAIRGLAGMPRRVLLVGHKLDTGSAQLNKWRTISSDAQAVGAFGEGSMLVAMWRAASANADYGLPIDCLPLDEPSGGDTAAWTLTLTNSAGAGAAIGKGGELPVYIGGERIAVAVSSADTIATLATKLHAAINAETTLPLTSTTAPTAGVLTLACRWAGETGNHIDIRAGYYVDESLPGGLACAVTVATAGSGLVTRAADDLALDLDGYRPTCIANPFTHDAAMAAWESVLAERWTANSMEDGQMVVAMRGDLEDHTAWLDDRNSAMVSSIHTLSDLTSPWATAAMAAAQIESSAVIDPAVPYTGRPLTGYLGAPQGTRWTMDELNTLLQAGGSPLKVFADGTGALLRMVTNWTQNAQGVPDRSMSSLEQIKTASYWRYSVVAEFNGKYQGYKLAQYLTEPIPGQKIMTPELGADIMLGLYKRFMEVGLMQNMPHYVQTLQVEADGANGKLKVLDEPLLVTQHYQTEVTSALIAGSL